MIVIENYGTAYVHNLEPFWDLLSQKLSMTNPLIVKDTLKIYKEAVFFLGEVVKQRLIDQKKSLQEEFDLFIKNTDIQ